MPPQPFTVEEVHQGEDRAAETELAITVGLLAYRVEDDGGTDADQYGDQKGHQQGFKLAQTERAPCGEQRAPTALPRGEAATSVLPLGQWAKPRGGQRTTPRPWDGRGVW